MTLIDQTALYVGYGVMVATSAALTVYFVAGVAEVLCRLVLRQWRFIRSTAWVNDAMKMKQARDGKPPYGDLQK